MLAAPPVEEAAVTVIVTDWLTVPSTSAAKNRVVYTPTGAGFVQVKRPLPFVAEKTAVAGLLLTVSAIALPSTSVAVTANCNKLLMVTVLLPIGASSGGWPPQPVMDCPAFSEPSDEFVGPAHANAA
jgi:hypothetical protein